MKIELMMESPTMIKYYEWEEDHPYLFFNQEKFWQHSYNISQVGYKWTLTNDINFKGMLSNGTKEYEVSVSEGGGVKLLDMTGLVELSLTTELNSKFEYMHYVIVNTTDIDNPDYSGLETVLKTDQVAFSGHLRFDDEE